MRRLSKIIFFSLEFAIGKLEQRLTSNIKEKLNLTQEDGHDEDPLGAKLIQFRVLPELFFVIEKSCYW